MSLFGCLALSAACVRPVAGLTTGFATSPQEAGSTSIRANTPRGLEMHVPAPEANPPTPEKLELGRRLFRDPILSRDSTKSCSSCHLEAHAFADTARVSTGVHGQRGTRNAPPLHNRAFGRSFFRDGRSPTLEDAVLRPIQAPDELSMTLPEVVRRLREHPTYPAAFAAAFDSAPIDDVALGRALATFVRSLLSGDSPADRFGVGDSLALTPAAIRGRALFLARANCTACHTGPYLTDERFHNTGVSWGRGDAGRETVTRDPADRGRFRTPSLRDVELTAPYMHDGSVRTLEEVVEFYDRGGGQNPSLDHRIRPLGLTPQERADLVAFLRALTGGKR
jgi:cytochrome c peroxidase